MGVTNISFNPDEEGKAPQRSKASTFNEKNYLNVNLGKGETHKELRIRLLPVSKDNPSPFEHIYMHSVHVSPEISANGIKAYVCLKKTKGVFTEQLGEKCPFCEARAEKYSQYKAALEEGRLKDAEDLKKESLSYMDNEVVIVRCIERGKEDEGPKFWKINVRSDKQDAYNQMVSLVRNYKQECKEEGREDDNLLDLYTGKDLKITIDRVQNKQGEDTNRTTKNVAAFGSPKPISADEGKIEEWVNDAKIWSDVFVAKPYEYTKLIQEGKTPWYDRTNGKWVEKVDYSTKKQTEEAQVPQDEAAVSEEPVEKKADTVKAEDGDLPF